MVNKTFCDICRLEIVERLTHQFHAKTNLKIPKKPSTSLPNVLIEVNLRRLHPDRELIPEDICSCCIFDMLDKVDPRRTDDQEAANANEN